MLPVEEYHIRPVPRYVIDNVRDSHPVQKLAELGHGDSAAVRHIFLLNRDGIGEQSLVFTHQAVQDLQHLRVLKLHIIQGIPVHDDTHPCLHLDVLGESPMTLTLQISHCIESLGPVESETVAEGLDVKLQLAAHPLSVRDFEECEKLVIDVLDVFQCRKCDILQLLETADVRAVPQQDCIGLLTVPACPSRLLEIGFGRIRQTYMHDESHVGLVNSHSESIGADHHPGLPRFPVLLPFGTHRMRQAGVIERRADSLCLKSRCCFLRFVTAAGIDDSCTRNPGANRKQLARLVLDLADNV